MELTQDANVTTQICSFIPSIRDSVFIIWPRRAPLTLLYAVDSVKQPGRDVEEGRPQDPGHQPPGPGDAAEVSGPSGLADVDVALDSQDQGQPDGDVVEHLGSRLHEQLV